MKIKIIFFLVTFILFFSCKTQKQIIKQQNLNITSSVIRKHTLQSLLWQQNAAEYKALAYQAYNLAQLRLDQILANNQSKKPIAIVTDIDETVLDNSPYAGKQIELDENYTSNRWADWVAQKKAKAIPGALAFFNYAKSKNVDVFYISNRSSKQTKETIENLKLKGFPFANETHVLLKTNESEKESRRNIVKETHKIVLLIGDNLSDFLSVFENHSTIERNNSADSLKNNFGDKFIVLPNPMYGDWETKGIFEGKYNWSNNQKDSIRLKKTTSY